MLDAGEFQLIEGLRRGEDSAFATLMERYSSALLRVARITSWPPHARSIARSTRREDSCCSCPMTQGDDERETPYSGIRSCSVSASEYPTYPKPARS